MGDRSNLFFHSSPDSEDGIGIYGHWTGTDMADAAMAVLNNPAFLARCDDASYAMRIGIQTALETLGADSKSETGFGLWTTAMGPCDNSYAIVHIFVGGNKPVVRVDGENIKGKVTAAKIRKAMVGE